MLRVMVIGLLLAVPAAGQEPPVVTTPPSWIPYRVEPGPSPAQIAALDGWGRHQKRIGIALIVSGSVIAAAGTALIVTGQWDDHCNHHHYYDDCGTSALTIAGATTSLLGAAAIIPGIVTYVKGGSDVAQARGLRQYYWIAR